MFRKYSAEHIGKTAVDATRDYLSMDASEIDPSQKHALTLRLSVQRNLAGMRFAPALSSGAAQSPPSSMSQ